MKKDPLIVDVPGDGEALAHGPLGRGPEVVYWVLLECVRPLHAAVHPVARVTVHAGEQPAPVLARIHREESLLRK